MISLFVLFRLAILLSVLRFTAFDYTFDIFNFSYYGGLNTSLRVPRVWSLVMPLTREKQPAAAANE
jgi:hypothetical protein